MLNPHQATDYSFEAIAWLITNDPSIALGFAVTAMVSTAGVRFSQLRVWVFAFVFAFLPLTIWLWDIPATGRFVCEHFHDGRAHIRSAHLYAVGIAAFLIIVLKSSFRSLPRH